MSRNLYGTYRGRKSLLQRILTAVAVILAVALLLALVALLVLPNYMTYTGDGLQFNVPLPKRPDQTAQPQPSEGADEPGFVIETEPAAATATPSAGAKVETDLSQFERRDVPLGLVAVSLDELLEGQDKGVILDMAEVDPATQGLGKALADAPYAAAYLNTDQAGYGPEGDRTMDFGAWATQVAALGFDELILADTVPQDDGAALAKLYRDTKAELDKAGWQGRLSLVLDQSLAGSRYDEDLMPAIAQSFDRLYFRRAMQGNVKTALTTNGFEDKPVNYVTVYATVPNVSWAWAILPPTQA